MKMIFFLVLAVCSILEAGPPAMAQTAGQVKAPSARSSPSATFLFVKGVVTVRDVQGKTRTASKGTTAFEEERVSVAKESQATLRLFDGSTLDLSSKSQLVLQKLRQPSEKVKNIEFQLAFGAILAKVKKLLSSQSSFEVKAGGVVCGVRGTEFAFSYDPDKDWITLKVHEGTVYVNSAGKTSFYHAGENLELLHGLPAPESTGASVKNTLGAALPQLNNSLNTSGSLGGGLSSGLGIGAALTDLNTQFTAGILVNQQNTLSKTSANPAAPAAKSSNPLSGLPVVTIP